MNDRLSDAIKIPTYMEESKQFLVPKKVICGGLPNFKNMYLLNKARSLKH